MNNEPGAPTATSAAPELARLIGCAVEVVVRRGRGRAAIRGRLEAAGGLGLTLVTPKGSGFFAWSTVESITAKEGGKHV